MQSHQLPLGSLERTHSIGLREGEADTTVCSSSEA